jgi:hypothetical protein
MYSSLFTAKCFFHMYHLHLLIQTYKFKKNRKLIHFSTQICVSCQFNISCIIKESEYLIQVILFTKKW